MEEDKKVKKNNKPMILIAAAALLIIAGVALIVTGNNKSFLAKEEPKQEEKDDDTKDDDVIDDQNRGVVPISITVEEITELINNKKLAEYSEETWQVGAINIVAHDENNEKYLVTYEEIQEDGTIVYKQTIVSVLNDEKSVELPGWVEGERDLTVYNFIYETINNDQPIEEPIEEPVEEPVEQPIEEPVEQPVEEPVDQPVEEPVEQVEVTE